MRWALTFLLCATACAERASGVIIDATTGAAIGNSESVVDGFPPVASRNGIFDIELRVKDGNPRITFRAPGYGPVGSVASHLDGANVPLFPTVLVRGVIEDVNGAPLAGATVHSLPVDRKLPFDSLEVTATSASDGSFALAMYQHPSEISVTRADTLLFIDRTRAPFALNSSGSLQMPRRGTIRGKLAGSGRPMPDTRVELFAPDLMAWRGRGDAGTRAGFQAATTRSDGSFQFNGLVPAHYDVSSITGIGRRIHHQDVDVLAGSDITVELSR